MKNVNPFGKTAACLTVELKKISQKVTLVFRVSVVTYPSIVCNKWQKEKGIKILLPHFLFSALPAICSGKPILIPNSNFNK